jgi:hypothetical protein
MSSKPQYQAGMVADTIRVGNRSRIGADLDSHSRVVKMDVVGGRKRNRQELIARTIAAA